MPLDACRCEPSPAQASGLLQTAVHTGIGSAQLKRGAERSNATGVLPHGHVCRG